MNADRQTENQANNRTNSRIDTEPKSIEINSDQNDIFVNHNNSTSSSQTKTIIDVYDTHDDNFDKILPVQLEWREIMYSVKVKYGFFKKQTKTILHSMNGFV